jgi:hypothetical protein
VAKKSAVACWLICEIIQKSYARPPRIAPGTVPRVQGSRGQPVSLRILRAGHAGLVQSSTRAKVRSEADEAADLFRGVILRNAAHVRRGRRQSPRSARTIATYSGPILPTARGFSDLPTIRPEAANLTGRLVSLLPAFVAPCSTHPLGFPGWTVFALRLVSRV